MQNDQKEGTSTKKNTINLTKSTLSGLFWMFSGAGAQAALQFLVTVILARILVPEDFGLVSAALIAVSFSEIFSKLGVGPALVQRETLEVRHIRTGFTMSLIFGTLLYAILYLLAPIISEFLQMEELTNVLRVISIVLPIKSTAVVSESLLQRKLAYKRMANIQVWTYAFGYGLVGIILSIFGFEVWALVAATIAQALLRTISLLIIEPHSMKPQFERLAFKDLMYFGTGFTIARIANYLALQGDNIVTGRWLGPQALGLYGRAYQLMAMPANLFGQVLDQVLFPVMAKVQDDTKRLTTAYNRGISAIALIVLPASIHMIILAPEIIDFLLGSTWVEVVGPFQILAIGMFFRTSYKISDSLTRATGAVYKRAWRQGIYAFLVILGSFIGQNWGLNGVAFGVLVALFINYMLMAHLSLRIISLTWKTFFVTQLPALLLSIVMGIVSWFIIKGLRFINFPTLGIIAISSIIIIIIAFLLLRFFPKVFLGKNGVWIINLLSNYFKDGLNKIKII